MWLGYEMASACAHIVLKVQNCKEIGGKIRRAMLEQYSYISGIAPPWMLDEMAEFITKIGRTYDEWRWKNKGVVSYPKVDSFYVCHEVSVNGKNYAMWIHLCCDKINAFFLCNIFLHEKKKTMNMHVFVLKVFVQMQASKIFDMRSL